MKKILSLILLNSILFLNICQANTKPPVKKTVDLTKSTINWKASKVTGTHTGTVKIKSGFVDFDGSKLTGGTFIIDMPSLTVTDLSGGGKDKLEGHLKSDDFFGVANFSESKLVIKSVTGMAMAGEFVVNADLTIKGITKPVSFKTKAAANSATATVKIDRTKYDIKYGSGSFFENLGDKAIDNEFELTISLVY